MTDTHDADKAQPPKEEPKPVVTPPPQHTQSYLGPRRKPSKTKIYDGFMAQSKSC